MPAIIDKDKCNACEACVSVCPVESITMVDGKADVNETCIDCSVCVDQCPEGAISMSE